MVRHTCVFLLSVLLTACAANTPVPRDHFYRLPGPTSITPVSVLADGIFVDSFIANGLYRERAILHTSDAAAIEIIPYHYHYWTDTPVRLVRDQLIRYLQEAGASTRVVDSADIPAAIRIHGKIIRFERHDQGTRDKVMVELQFQVEQEGRDVPILLDTYTQQLDVAGNSMSDVVVAFAKTLSMVFSVFATDLENNISD